MASARLGLKVSAELSAVAVPSPRSSALSASSQQAGVPSPALPEGSMLTRALSVLKRHQCGYEEEAVTVCLRAQAAAASTQPSAVSSACGGYISSLRYCQLQTQQHNHPVAPAFLY